LPKFTIALSRFETGARMRPWNHTLIDLSGRVGQRVSRKNSDELGLVVQVVRGVVKVKWDRGRTSYYRPDMPANVKLAEP
jgi:hypothetical protein